MQARPLYPPHSPHSANPVSGGNPAKPRANRPRGPARPELSTSLRHAAQLAVQPLLHQWSCLVVQCKVRRRGGRAGGAVYPGNVTRAAAVPALLRPECAGGSCCRHWSRTYCSCYRDILCTFHTLDVVPTCLSVSSWRWHQSKSRIKHISFSLDSVEKRRCR
jgi:hypothetical protein